MQEHIDRNLASNFTTAMSSWCYLLTTQTGCVLFHAGIVHQTARVTESFNFQTFSSHSMLTRCKNCQDTPSIFGQLTRQNNAASGDSHPPMAMLINDPPPSSRPEGGTGEQKPQALCPHGIVDHEGCFLRLLTWL